MSAAAFAWTLVALILADEAVRLLGLVRRRRAELAVERDHAAAARVRGESARLALVLAGRLHEIGRRWRAGKGED